MMWKEFENQKEKYKIALIAGLLAGCCLAVYYFQVSFGVSGVVALIFYIPIIFAAIWWKRKGLIVAGFSSAFLIFNYVFLRPDITTNNDYFRALMFIVVCFVAVKLSERIAKAKDTLAAANQQLNASNQQLDASNQQLRATDQQLRAANQQLKALNQQLLASEQEIRKKEAETREARKFAESIVATVREPFVILDGDLRIVTAGQSFYNTFKVTPKETEGKLMYV